MIRTGVRLELYRAFHNLAYYIALGLGCAIAVLHFVMQVLPKTKAIGVFMNIDYPHSVFNSCLALDLGGFHQSLFFYSVVLLGTLPFGMSYFTDLRDGYIKNIYTRMDRKGYLLGKYLAVFLTAGTVCIIPLILNMALTMAVLPCLIPQVGTSVFAVAGAGMFSELFYSHPFLYVLVYLIIDFCMVGMFACLALSLTKVLYNRYIVLFAPFVLFFTLQTVMMYTGFNAAGPYYILNPTQPTWENVPTVLTEMILLFLVGFFTFYLMGGKKRDAI